MTNVFGDLSTTGLEEAEDRLGGFQVYDSDIYTGIVKAFYAVKSNDANSKARGLSLILDLNGKEYRETFWVTNKAGENFFRNKQDNTKKVPLPGFQTAEDICYATTGKALAEQDAEDKIINVYNADQKKEIPTNVNMLMGVVGQKVSVGIIKQLVNRQQKNDATGEYVDLPETREENTINKVFHTESKMTIAEAKAKKTIPEFWDAWVNKNKGQTIDRRKIKDGASSQGGKSGAPQSSGAKPSGTSSLFDKK